MKGKDFDLDCVKYEGQWLGDKQNGYGVEMCPNDARYEGQYNMGKKHGYGKFYRIFTV